MKKHRYPGIHSFTDAERGEFFGREREIKELYRLLLLNPVVVLFGKSGTGKTSLLQAGVAPLLHERLLEPLKLRLNDTANPIHRQLWEQFNSGDYLPVDTPDNLSLSELCTRFDSSLGGEALSPVLLLDQFEELFTLYPDHSEERADFIAQLAELLHRQNDSAPRVRVVISLRSDFLYLLDRLSARIPAILRCRYELRALDEDNARRAITAPATLPGDYASQPFQFSAEALETALDGLSGQSETGAAGSREVEAFLLQQFCRRLENQLIQEQAPAGFSVTPAYFGGGQGITKMLDDFYAEVLARFPDAAARRRVQQLVEEKLISGERRIIGERETLKNDLGLTNADLDLLCAERLLRQEPRGAALYYELSHDTLLAPVLKAKKKRLAEEEERKRAEELEKEEARIAREKDEAERRRKRAMMTAVIAGTLVLLSVVAIVLAIIKTNQAEQAARKAVVALLDAARKDILHLQYDPAFSKMKDASGLGSIKDSVAFELMEIAWFHHHTGHDELAREPYDLAADLLGKGALKGRMDFEKMDPDRTQFIKARYFGEMVALKGGNFQMQGGKYGGEVNEYEATVADFQLSKYETTVWQYNLFCVANGRNITQRISNDGKTIEEEKYQPSWGWVGNNPVVFVSWYDAVVYANWLSEKMGKTRAYEISTERDSLNEAEEYWDEFKWTITPIPNANGFRLPTELEWEFAARGGLRRDSFIYSGSDTLDSVAWYSGNSDNRTQPAGAKKINGAGIFDMSGNVWEWCYDWYGGLPAENAMGARKGSDRVYRGGSWNNYAEFCRAAYRDYHTPSFRDTGVGFRLALQ